MALPEDEYRKLFEQLTRTALARLTQARIDRGGDKSFDEKEFLVNDLDAWFTSLSEDHQNGARNFYEELRRDIVNF